jgi:hypothetical protein
MSPAARRCDPHGGTSNLEAREGPSLATGICHSRYSKKRPQAVPPHPKWIALLLDTLQYIRRQAPHERHVVAHLFAGNPELLGDPPV